MGDLQPQKAASLAAGVYAVQSERGAKVFLEQSVFSQQKETSKHLTAKVGFRIINVNDGFGICARGGKGYETDTFLIFRGTTTTNYGADIISDLRFGVETSRTGLPVHIGFNHAFCSMQSAIAEFVNSKADANGVIHIIGHSLGGAVATLAADWLSSRKQNKVMLYTFGCPKTGLEFFAHRLTTKLTAENMHRVYHSSDVVPMVPVFPFTHAPINHCGYQISSNAMVSLAAHKIANYAKSVKNSSWDTLKAKGEQAAYGQSIEYWLKSDKPLNPADPKTWEWINNGLAWVLRKVIGVSASVIQAPFLTAISLADKIAWILHKGIDLSIEASEWVLRIMRKIMQALGMKLVKAASDLTRQFMCIILRRLIERMSQEAMRAVRGLLLK